MPALPPAAAPAPAVDIALFELYLGRDLLSRYAGWLDDDERCRADRFRTRVDRDRFVARRGQLRALLAEATGDEPHHLRIEADAHGKPFLPDHAELHFNVSHSHGLGLCVIARDEVDVGCDLEWRNPELACPAVAGRLFAPGERAALDALPPDLWVEGFFNCWTRKEAYVKALGLGLSYPLDCFTVSVDPVEAARLVDADPGFWLSSFEPAPGYQAALVLGRPSHRRCQG